MHIIELLRESLQIFTILFVMILMFNIGFNQSPKKVWGVVKANKKYFAKLLLYNNLFVPFAVASALQWVPMDQSYKNGLIVMFVCTGAPIVVAMVKQTGHRITYATASILSLITMTVLTAPIILPLLIEDASVQTLGMVSGLVLEIVLPLLVGILVQNFNRPFIEKIGQISEKLESVLLNVMVFGMVFVFFPEFINLLGEGVMVIGVLLLVAVFLGGYLLDYNESKKEKQLATAFASGQRDIAIALSIAMNNFSDVNLLLAIMAVATLGTILFYSYSKYLGHKETAVSH